MSIGYFSASTFAARNGLPVQNAEVTISKKENGNVIFSKTLFTDKDGNTPSIALDAPPVEISLNPDSNAKPYSTYDLFVLAPGYIPLEIRGIQIFANQESFAPIEMLPFPAVGAAPGFDSRIIVDLNALETASLPYSPLVSLSIPENTMYQNDEASLSTGLMNNGIMPLVLDEVVIPEYIVVHLGRPEENAENIWVSFPDYIKNVASSEIYPTWPEESLKANIYAQISFALNRIYTEWYRSKGYDFQITNSTSFDQKYVKGRNIFDSVSTIVDEIFTDYVSKPGTLEPYFTEYCDGKNVSCKGLKQWGTVDLANQGLSAEEILEYYYGPINIESASSVNGVPESYPATPLRLGSSGEDVRTIQRQLNRIGKNYPSITKVVVNGDFGPDTESAVKQFQTIFKLSPDGIVGRGTWYKIGYIYTSVKKLAELDSEGERPDIRPGSYPGYPVQQGQSGDNVRAVQYILTYLSRFYFEIPPIAVDGQFGPQTTSAVKTFQQIYNLPPDGVVGPDTWNQLINVYLSLKQNMVIPNDVYPGYPLKQGSSGDSVEKVQVYLDAIRLAYPVIPPLTVDGQFGPQTTAAVKTFQQYFGLPSVDGIVGPQTWNTILDIYYSVLNRDFYAGTPLKLGSQGPEVNKAQTMLRYLSTANPQIPKILVDGKFGPQTEAAVKAFQTLVDFAVDGVVGRNTWDRLVLEYNNLYYGTKNPSVPVEVEPTLPIDMQQSVSGPSLDSSRISPAFSSNQGTFITPKRLKEYTEVYAQSPLSQERDLDAHSSLEAEEIPSWCPSAPMNPSGISPSAPMHPSGISPSAPMNPSVHPHHHHPKPSPCSCPHCQMKKKKKTESLKETTSPFTKHPYALDTKQESKERRPNSLCHSTVRFF